MSLGLRLSAALLLCACGSDTFVSATGGDAGGGGPDGAISTEAGLDSGGGDANLCTRLGQTPQFCMDFDEGSPTAAYQHGQPFTLVPSRAAAALSRSSRRRRLQARA